VESRIILIGKKKEEKSCGSLIGVSKFLKKGGIHRSIFDKKEKKKREKNHGGEKMAGKEKT